MRKNTFRNLYSLIEKANSIAFFFSWIISTVATVGLVALGYIENHPTSFFGVIVLLAYLFYVLTHKMKNWHRRLNHREEENLITITLRRYEIELDVIQQYFNIYKDKNIATQIQKELKHAIEKNELIAKCVNNKHVNHLSTITLQNLKNYTLELKNLPIRKELIDFIKVWEKSYERVASLNNHLGSGLPNN